VNKVNELRSNKVFSVLTLLVIHQQKHPAV